MNYDLYYYYSIKSQNKNIFRFDDKLIMINKKKQ